MPDTAQVIDALEVDAAEHERNERPAAASMLREEAARLREGGDLDPAYVTPDPAGPAALAEMVLNRDEDNARLRARVIELERENVELRMNARSFAQQVAAAPPPEFDPVEQPGVTAEVDAEHQAVIDEVAAEATDKIVEDAEARGIEETVVVEVQEAPVDLGDVATETPPAEAEAPPAEEAAAEAPKKPSAKTRK